MEDNRGVRTFEEGLVSRDPADFVGVLLVFLILLFSIIRDPLEAYAIKGNHVLVMLFLGVILVQSLARGRFPCSDSQRRLLQCSGSLVACLTITTLLGIARGTTDWGAADAELRDLLFGQLFLIALIGCQGAAKNRDRLWELLLWCGSLAAFLGYFWIIQRGPAVLGLLFFDPLPDGRMVGGFLGPNEFGAFIAIVATGILARSLSAEKARFALAGILLSTLLWVPLVATGSRGALGGAALGAAFCYLLWLLVTNRRYKRKLLVLTAAAIVLVAGAALASRLPSFSMLLHRLSLDILSDARVLFMTAGWGMFVDSPFVGFGVGGFTKQLPAYTGITTATPPHNEFINVLVSGGLLPLAFLALLFFSTVRESTRRALAHPQELAIAAALLVFISQELFFNYLTRPKLGFIFWFLCWLSATPSLKRSRTETRDESFLEYHWPHSWKD